MRNRRHTQGQIAVRLASAYWIVSSILLTTVDAEQKPDPPHRYLIETVAGSGERGSSPDGTAAKDARFDRQILQIALADDGTLYVAEPTGVRVVRDGVLDSLPAPGLPLMNVNGIALDGDLLYVAGTTHPFPPGVPVLLRYDLQTGDTVDLFQDTCPPDKWPGACPRTPRILAVVDHSVVFTTGGQKRVYAIDPDGSVFHFAIADRDLPGFGDNDFNESGAAQGAVVGALTQIAARPGRDTLLMADSQYCRIRLVDSTGIIRTIAGSAGPLGDDESCRFSGDGGSALAAGLDGGQVSAAFGSENDTMIAERYRIRRVDSRGRIETIAGIGDASATCRSELDCCTNEPTPALEAHLVGPILGSVDAEGSVYFIDDTCLGPRVRRLRPVGGGPE